ncbi:MAG: ATP-binding protein [Bacteroidota bacterium]
MDGITLDITERKKADELLAQSEARLKENEQRLLAAQKVARMGDFTFNFSSNVWNCSAELDVITGLNATDILSFDKWVGLISDDVREEIINKIYPLIQEGTLPSGHYLDCKIKRAYDGEERWVSIVGEIELNESGKPLQLKGTVQDITERKKAEAEILKLNESLERKVEERTVELKQLNAELEAFSYTVSHDLQNPIRSLAGFSRILLNDYSKILDEDGREHLRNIEASAKRMSSLIRDLLNFAKLGKVTTAKANVDMNSIAQAAVAEIKPSAENLKTEIVLHELDCARCDAGLIRQVWNNLIGNAVKYSSKKDRPLVEIGMQQINGENAYYIRDNGAGFDMENSGKLFKAFERLHKHEFEGTGIGLSIVERIITKHGGSVWAESKPEQGAVFYFTLPSKGSAA